MSSAQDTYYVISGADRLIFSLLFGQEKSLEIIETLAFEHCQRALDKAKTRNKQYTTISKKHYSGTESFPLIVNTKCYAYKKSTSNFDLSAIYITIETKHYGIRKSLKSVLDSKLVEMLTA